MIVRCEDIFLLFTSQEYNTSHQAPGGEIVPAVTLVTVSVVSVRSMSVAELCAGLYRVGVVMVVRRLL